MTTQVNGTTGVSKVQDGVVTQADLAANVVGNGPAFRSTRINTNQVLSASSWQKLLLNGESFDTANCYDPSTGIFTPNVAGYYLLTGIVTVTTGMCVAGLGFNGAVPISGVGWGGTQVSSCVTLLQYFNGTTDYVSLYVYPGAISEIYTNGTTFFSGFLVRAA